MIYINYGSGFLFSISIISKWYFSCQHEDSSNTNCDAMESKATTVEQQGTRLQEMRIRPNTAQK